MLEALDQNLLNLGLLTILAAATWTDLRERRIPNPLVAAGLAAGMLGHAALGGGTGLAVSAIGAVAGLLCLLPFYIGGGMGAGDVKLMAVCGAFLGPSLVVVTAASSLLIGGVVGVFLYFRIGDDSGTERLPDTEPYSTASQVNRPGIPYAMAISAGALVTLAAADLIAAVINGGISG